MPHFAKNAGAALLFNPEPSEMYAEDACTFVDMSGLTGELCGKSRPIHFRGVCTVVSKLFHIVAPDRAYFGQKDAQQLSVIRRMVRDLNFDMKSSAALLCVKQTVWQKAPEIHT